MLVVIGLVLVFFPASIALVMHDRFVRPFDTAGKRWMWYGAYSAIISWIVLAAKFIQHWGDSDILFAFGNVKNLTFYGLLAIATAILAPLVVSILCILFKNKRKPDKGEE